METHELTTVRRHLSHSQTLILTGQKLQPEDPLYNMIVTFSIDGELSPERFEQAFTALIKGSDVLRTVFENTDDIDTENWRQVVLPDFKYSHPFIDLSTSEEPQKAISQWIAKRKLKRFDIRHCLFDSVLIKLGNGQFLWYLNQHHLLTDAWSTGVVFRKLSEIYSSLNENGEPETSIPQFSHYLELEQRKLQSKQFSRAKRYWLDNLVITDSSSTFYRPTQKSQSGNTSRTHCGLGELRSQQISELAKSEGFAGFSHDLSVMQIFATVLIGYLYRVTGNEIQTIGTPTHSRTSQELKDTPGMLINIFPLQVRVEETDTFRSLYEKVAASNQQLLINALPGSVDMQQSRQFDVVLNYIPSSFGEFAGMPVKSEWVHCDSGDRNHLLRLQIHNFDDMAAFTLFFDTNDDTFQGEEKHWPGEDFLAMFDSFISDPERLVLSNALPTSKWALEAIYKQANQNTKPDISALNQHTVIELFESKCEVLANDVAVQSPSGKLTYAQLKQRIDELSEAIIANGISAGSVVAIITERSIETVIAAYAVLKANCCFLPIEPSYPKERIGFMLEDSGCKLILTQARLQQLLIGQPIDCIYLDQALNKMPGSRVKEHKAKLTDSAYIIYTSGSTGKPKGVEVLHQGLSNYACWASAYYLQGERLTFPLFSSISFDLTITSMFVPLISSGKLVIYPEPEDPSEITICKVIEDNLVDVIKLTPAHLALIQSMDFSDSALKKLIVGGEDFKSELANTVSRYFGDKIAIYNEYGPTETTVACIVHKFESQKDKGGSVPIGKPISNTQVYLLDSQLNPVPPGVKGELYISGVGLAKGYINRPEMNAERFCDNPHLAGQKMYKTGDLAMVNPKGQIEYLGRNDHQVKIKGVRIEPGEIEAQLLHIPGVSEALVDTADHLSFKGEDEKLEYCVKCGLAANHPSAQLDEHKVCRICRVYSKQEELAQGYFSNLDALQIRIRNIKAKSKGKQDSIMLLSGGKDSSYALCKLVDMGLNPLVFTLDNGFISDGAKANIKRLVDRLGLELIVGETPAMNAIFADSLKRFSNVCNGCFKTIYTLSMNIAKERGINTICTGLSRGQIFETRVAHLFQQGCFDPQTIDQQINQARRAYHRTEDIIATTLDVKVFEDDNIFDQIQYLDFYRYTDVTLDEMYEYLHNIAPWIRPSDTGRSTNCLINDAGIYVHKKERGYHNYALPYSWDVRLGHKERNAALEELDDEIDVEKVENILNEVGYSTEDVKPYSVNQQRLIAYYVAPAEVPKNILQKALTEHLPVEYIPNQFVWLSAMPLTSNGKVDRQALPQPRNSRRELVTNYAAPETDDELLMVEIWSRLLNVEEVGVEDNFFDLGGDSIVNIQVVAAAKERGIDITPQQVFDHSTIRSLLAVASRGVQSRAQQQPVVGEVPLLPSHKRYFSADPQTPQGFCQYVLLQNRKPIDIEALGRSFSKLLLHHDALRSHFEKRNDTWTQIVGGPEDIHFYFEQITLNTDENMLDDQWGTQKAKELAGQFDLLKGQLVVGCLVDKTASQDQYLLIAVHHLVMDGVSWWVLLQDLELSLDNDTAKALPPKSCSVGQWGEALQNYHHNLRGTDSSAYWQTLEHNSQPWLPEELKTNDSSPVVKNLSVTLNQSTTKALINQVPASINMQVPDLLITALAKALLATNHSKSITLDIEGHGREELGAGLDVMRTIGWFTSIYPVTFELDSNNLLDDLKNVKETLRRTPNRGLDFGVLKYLGDSQNVNSENNANVLFNYMGLWQRTLSESSRFTFVKPISAEYCGHRLKEHLLEVNGIVFDDRLVFDFTFDEKVLPNELIQNLSKQFISILNSLIRECIDSEQLTLTPSDFGNQDIDQAELDDILDEFGE